MKRFAYAISIGAFLLFLIQPLVSKILLPWYGGSTTLWTACMLFFQTALLVGYLYANLLATRLSPRLQAMVHIAVLVLACVAAWLLFPPGPDWKPTPGNAMPYGQILLTLGVCVGIPFCVLAASSPLLQAWFAEDERNQGKSAYRLYSLSNIGSSLGLLVYPFMLEPLLPASIHERLWLVLFTLYAVVMVLCALPLLRCKVSRIDAPDASSEQPRPSMARILYWLLLSAAGSVILLAVTNQLCQEVAVVPFLWVLPLLLYLMTFVIVFGRDENYPRLLAAVALIGCTLLTCWGLGNERSQSLPLQVLIYSSVLFFGCLVFHGELVRHKPCARHLTLFYLIMSLGGAIGGAAVCLLAPLVFGGYWELHLSLVLGLVVAVLALSGELKGRKIRQHMVWTALAAVISIGSIAFLGHNIAKDLGNDVATKRGFYGVLHVKDSTARPGQLYYFYHGRTLHGAQIQVPEMRTTPTLYFTPGSGVGWALQQRAEAGTLHVGVIGMGIGTLAAYARPGDTYRFYEIDPLVDAFARSEYFSYLKDATGRGAAVSVGVGDGRSLLEIELATGSQQFDVLVLDAFSSGSIPMHLLTRECMELYWQHLKPDGVLAVHISNRMLDLRPVLARAAEDSGKQAISITNSGEGQALASVAQWMLISDHEAFLKEARNHPEVRALPKRRVLWQDNDCGLMSVLKWHTEATNTPKPQ